jgi:hypothetical protein
MLSDCLKMGIGQIAGGHFITLVECQTAPTLNRK